MTRPLFVILLVSGVVAVLARIVLPGATKAIDARLCETGLFEGYCATGSYPPEFVLPYGGYSLMACLFSIVTTWQGRHLYRQLGFTEAQVDRQPIIWLFEIKAWRRDPPHE